MPAAALFVMIGGEPHTRWLPDAIARVWARFPGAVDRSGGSLLKTS